MARFGVLRPLAIPDMRRLWLATALSLTGDGAYFVAIAWLALAIGDAGTLAYIALGWSAGIVAMLPFAGVVADRRSRRDVLIGSDLARALVLATMGVISLGGSPPVAALIGLSALHGAAEAFFAPAFNGLIPRIIDAPLLMAANALEQVLRPLAYRLLGPAIGASLVAVWSAGGALLIDAGTFLCSAALIARIPRDAAPASDGARGDLGGELRAALGYVRGQRWLLIVMGVSALSILLVWGAVESLVPYTIKNDLGGGAGAYAALLACSGVGGLIGGLFIGQARSPRRPGVALVLSWTLSALALGSYAVAGEVWQLWPLGVVFGAGMAYGGALWSTCLQTRVPDAMLGRVGALDYVLSIGLAPVSLALVGPLSHVIDPVVLLGGCGLGAGMILASALLSRSVRAL